ncbi:putative type IX secretion system sortase PorU2 [Thermoflexibacter ruber]|uniref:FlgD Ig-like domain-containing protein n=1 Tax=Thermoflexibacter ruber TaxID=1003 RepID=A0A1I2FM58_9BACT|nr:C25 family cysteine peptidase [Thermoflexibacter ruber]SFF06572.1 FlgD Ig-like domain-containing protein [Thermoflexibacter ruber]
MKFSSILSYCIFLFLSLFTSQLFAQIFGNEWIDYSKTYYKIPINREGIYRISFAQLQSAGFPVATTDPRKIQMFFRGKEIPITVAGEDDGTFNTADYIEFYARNNRFDLFEEMFDSPANLPRVFNETYPYFIYYPDFAFYFLTVAKVNETPKRIRTYTENNPNIAPELFHTQFVHGDNAIGPNFSFGPLNPVGFNGLDERGALFSHFTEGVGNVSVNYAASPAKINLPVDLVDVKIKEARDANVQPKLLMKIVGKTNTPHSVSIFADILPDSQRVTVETALFNNRSLVTIAKDLPEARFPERNGRFFISFRVNRVLPTGSEVIAIGAAMLSYPQGFDMQSATRRRFLLNANPNGKSKIQLTNVASGTRIFDITDDYEVVQIGTTSTNNNTTLTGGVNNTNIQRTLLATSTTSSILYGITRVNFPQINPAGRFDYLIVTDERLLQPVNGVNAVQAYADYRASTKGGSYRPLVITFRQLCDMFTYGELLPLSIRRFANYMVRTHQSKYLFLVGKGLQFGFYEFHGLMYSPTATLARPFQNMVPPWGVVGSDNEITAGQSGFPAFVPSLATGRLSANNPTQVLNYLNKVREYEAPDFDEPWKKEILHLSGGFSLSENRAFRNYVDGFKRIAEGNFFGGNVETISKRTTDYVEFIDVTQQINEGKLLVTFFGHSSLESSDIEIGKVSEARLGFRNKGRYPFMLVNGCGSGDAFQRSVSLGEDWIITPDKGAIGFIAHGHIGLDGPLRAYTQSFYETLFGIKGNINKPIGVVMQEFLRRYLNTYSDPTAISNAQQFVLQCDPALVLFKSTLPDYKTSDSEIFVRAIGNRALTAQVDSFRLGIIVSNLGITDNRSFSISVKRTYSDGSVEQLRSQRYRPVNFKDTLYYTVVNPRNAQEKIVGLNTFEVMVDADYQITEMREDNNIGILAYTFRRSNMINIAPKDFSIVSKQPLTFIAQNTNPFTRERLYRFQLDTAHTFNSPALKDTVVYGYVTPFWTTRLLADNQQHDSTVYYWRVRFAELTAEDDPTWAEASFTYIRNSPDGWSQSKMPQFAKNNLDRIVANIPQRKWTFEDTNLRIEAKAIGSASPNWANWNLSINGQTLASAATCAVSQPTNRCNASTDKLIMVSIDGETGRVYREFLSTVADACGSNALVTALEQCLPQQNSGLLPAYMDNVKMGDYVIIMNSRFVSINALGNNGGSIAALRQIGVNTDDLRARLGNGAAFIIVGRKGAPAGSATVQYGANTSQEINLNTTLRITASKGTVNSTLIGPAAEWGNVWRLINNAENPSRESWKLDVIGVDFANRERVLKENIRADGMSLADINASSYPYLKLRLNVEDAENRTPYQLQRWQVIYKEVPEGILLYDTLTYRENTILEIVEGDSIKIGFNFVNISGNDFKENNLVVEYDINNLTSGRRTRIRENILAPKRNQITYFKTKLYSLDYYGQNRMTVTVNPRLQPEQIYENNQLEVRFNVKEDDINPVLDVAIDGRHIMDGEIVSPTPLISIGLTDENKYLVNRDTSHIIITLTKDCPNCTPKRIYMNNPNLVWTVIPEKNKIQIEYKSDQLENGTYKLTVQGRDVRGNIPGLQPYSVTFKVINETKISNFYPYPNPFTTNMRFVFTLTGEVPDDIRIQIMTITGKVVRTIHKEELGNLRVGDNISEFSWDGTDQFGDQLARGVYLFKVDIRKQGRDYERFETAGDGLFEKGYGKIYLMR